MPEKRAATEYAVSTHAMSERRACRLTGLSRSTRRYVRRRTEPEGLRQRLIELATERPRFGYPRLHILLRREGSKVNRKRVYRLYSQEGLKIRIKRRRKFAAMKRGKLGPPVKPNDRWSLDFVSDTLADGRALRILTVVDDFTKFSPVVAVGVSLSSGHVIRALEQAIVMPLTPHDTSTSFEIHRRRPTITYVNERVNVRHIISLHCNPIGTRPKVKRYNPVILGVP